MTEILFAIYSESNYEVLREIKVATVAYSALQINLRLASE